ncbi:MAG TPA: GDP-L-fucose synthase [Chryseosolibacter sp.]
MNKDSRIYVAGHNGMVGSAIVRKLRASGYGNLILLSSRELDLRHQQQVESFFKNESPEYVFMAAAKVGGILANNTYRAEFLYDNLMMESNVIHQSYRAGVKKLLFLGSSCIYPKNATQPMKESELLSGYLEPTNEPYAIAKIAGIKLCETYRDQYGCNFISAMPTNLYGPNDNFDLQTSHVLPALLRKFNEAKSKKTPVTVWGSGKPLREFMHVDDVADACLFLMLNYNEHEFVNIGSGEEVSIMQLAEIIKEVTQFDGEIVWDKTKPDGTPRKLMDVSKLRSMGWTHQIKLKDGIRKVYQAELAGALR